MNLHRVDCHCCENGRVFTSKHGGLDPDVWEVKGGCKTCDGHGNLMVEDRDEVINEDEIVLTYTPAWKCPDASKRYKATYDGVSATGAEQADAVAALIEKVHDIAEERQFENATNAYAGCE